MDDLTLQVILVKGDPNGIKKIQLDNWNGKAFIFPRSEIGNLKNFNEVNGGALYFLFGENEKEETSVYIGESNKCSNRLDSHGSNKDFWDVGFVFLDPPNRKSLETLAVEMAKKAKRFKIENTVTPSEEDQNDFGRTTNLNYLNGVKKILAAFNYPVFESIQDAVVNKEIYYLESDGVDAKAQLLKDGSLNVLKGSFARIMETKSFKGWSVATRKKFISDGTFQKHNEESYVYTRDVIFKSPSAAAATTTGRSINGWVAWKDDDGNSLDENLRK